MSEGSACRHLVTRLGKVPKFHMETCRHLSDCELRCVGGDGQAGQPAAQPALFLCSRRERLPQSQECPPRAASASLRVHTAADSLQCPARGSVFSPGHRRAHPTTPGFRVKQPGQRLCSRLMLERAACF